MSKGLKTIIWIVVIILIVWGIYALSTQNTSPELGEGPVKIGWIGPLTGEGAIYGIPLKNSFAIGVEEINAAGGIDGHQIEVIYEDGKCTGKDAATAMQKLANTDQVQVVIASMCSSGSISSAPIADQAKVFLFSPSSSSPDLTGISQYFARNYPSDSTQSVVLANIAYNDKGWNNVAVIQEQTDYAQALYEAFKENFESMGGTVTNEVFVTGETDFRTMLAKVKNQNPDAVFLDTQTGTAAARIAKQMGEMGWDIPLMASDVLITDQNIVSENQDVLNGTIGAAFGIDPDNEKFQNLISTYKDKYGEEPPYQAYDQVAYDAAYLVKEGIEKVGYDGTALAEWIRTVKNWQGASGSVTIKENGDPESGHVPKVIIDGEAVPYEN